MKCLVFAALIASVAAIYMYEGPEYPMWDGEDFEFLGEGEDHSAEIGKFNVTAQGGACVTLETMRQRMDEWVAKKVPYCQCATNICCGKCDWCKWRCDCSGYASYVWGLSAGLTTWSIQQKGNAIPVWWEDAQPGDALVCRQGERGHAIIFNGWVEFGKTYNCYQESGCSGPNTVAHVKTCRADRRLSGCGEWKFFRSPLKC